MEPLTFIIAIMGCADSGQACQQARVEPVQYPTAAACQAAMPNALRSNTDLSYPVIQANCQRTTPGLIAASKRGNRADG